MAGRQIFSQAEKFCVQELIVKYKLNSHATMGAGNPAAKKTAWARLTEEFNSIETNTRRTETQLKKCWDNIKNRRKQELASEKRERMRTGGGPPPSTSTKDNIDEALTEATDVELPFAIDSDTIFQEGPSESCGDVAYQVTVNEQSEEGAIVELQADHSYTAPSEGAEPILGEGSQNIVPEQTSSIPPVTARARTTSRRSESRLSDYTASSQATARNVRSRVITDEFALREANYKRAQEREEELHRLKIAEREFQVKAAEANYKKAVAESEWLGKAAEEHFKKAVIERQNAEEVLRCNIILREAAEAKKL